MKYRCNAIVDAIQVREDNYNEVLSFCKGYDKGYRINPYYNIHGNVVRIEVIDDGSSVYAYPGDYIVRTNPNDTNMWKLGFFGIRPMQKEIFESLFTPMDEGPSPLSYWDM